MQTYSGKPTAVLQPDDLRKTEQKMIILDCRPFEDYEFCHLVGAIHVDIDAVLSSAKDPTHDPKKGGRNPLPKTEVWQKQLCDWGVEKNSLVVAYDNASGAEGAARAWWLLMASGIRAAVLDGGWDAAMTAHLPLTEDITQPTPSIVKFTNWLLPTVDLEAVEKYRKNPEWILLDSRAPERWRGEIEPFDPIPGHIQGSKNIFFKENLVDGRFKQSQELRHIYTQIIGDIPSSQVIASCGSGMTACHTILALYQAGIEGVSIYIGSYSEWCRNNPNLCYD
ncbi:MAG: rhodanese-like domain-containing protein [Holophagaceae bacterium]|nr:rhodanese-like domain-containing protein [Holophagaceae bacterium]